ncbi:MULTISPECIES: DUF2612 domain-containing protein [Acinetobacter]|uniref:DUF2612 domain-containing protein n=1 Tax=Acinetobacter higginsii TaxID=70347 RepID=N8XIY0_9GAMM|nr:DUF2612 domain-containing protein [Acinetobacter higginsii]ENV08989.1 hypothetical protein F966_02634 [Acinetobacter higginsii]NNP67533.1 hypothetical protein [Acinetobacter sp. Ac_5812]
MDAKKYIALLTSQHRDKPKFRETVEISLNPLIDCLECLNSIGGKFNLETAKGDQLQILADWVGSRDSIPNAVAIPFFGFADQEEALPFGETNDPAIGGFWRDSGVGSFRAYQMSPQLFRSAIKAKILLNKSDCTLESAKEIIEQVLNKRFKIVDNLNMTVSFLFLEDFDTHERELVRMLFPLPSGVRLLFGDEDEY